MAKKYDKLSLARHKRYQGKLEMVSRFPLKNKDDLSIAYTPGVAAVSLAIAKDKRLARTLTWKGRTVVVVSDGSSVLGLGNLGPEAALPVMEGKAALFKEFADVDAVPIVLGTQDTEEIIAAVKAIAPGFSGINLEDIAAPRCFEIEERLRKMLDIPVFHDDQHGTAIVVLAALTNALRVVGKKLPEVKIVINGAGAAAIAIAKILIADGANREKMIMLDSKGILNPSRADLRGAKREIADQTNKLRITGVLPDALYGADVFIGVSVGGALKPEWTKRMREHAIVFAMANPTPELSFEDARRTKIAVFGTGRSDYPNQINNVLAFPGVFRGALDAKATAITEEMERAAARAIAGLIPPKKLRPDNIIPKPFDTRVAPAVASAVARAWKASRK